MIELLLRLTPAERSALAEALEKALEDRVPAEELAAYVSRWISARR